MKSKKKAELELYGSPFIFWWVRLIITPLIIYLFLYFLVRPLVIRMDIDFLRFLFRFRVLYTSVFFSLPLYIWYYIKYLKITPIIYFYDTHCKVQIDSPKFKYLKLFYELFVTPKYRTFAYSDIEEVYRKEGLKTFAYCLSGSINGLRFEERTALVRLNSGDLDKLTSRFIAKGVKVFI